MAEGQIPTNPRLLYCHSCSHEFTGGRFTVICPRCNQGFVEEVAAGVVPPSASSLRGSVHQLDIAVRSLPVPEMDQSQFQSIPKAIITKQLADSLVQCYVCFDTFKMNEDKVRELPCKHMYHDECIFPWLQANPSCPACRAPLRNINRNNGVASSALHRLRQYMEQINELIGNINGRVHHNREEGSLTSVTGTVPRSSAALPVVNATQIPRPTPSHQRAEEVRAPRRAAALPAVNVIQDIHRPRPSQQPTEEVRAPRRAAALRATNAIHDIYHPRCRRR